MSKDKKCWACNKTLIGEEKFGLCERCLNKYGSPALALAVLGVTVGGKYVWQNRQRIVKGIINSVKR